jgi:transcriptional regulator with XRE-family HTH domain
MPMSPDLTRELVTTLRAWYESSDVSQKNLARKLYLSPQQLSEIFAGRNRPTGDQVLRIQEFLRTNNMKTDHLDPRTKPRPTTSDPGRPKTLSAALDRISLLEAQLRGSAKPAVPASPTAKAPTGDPGADPTYPPTGTPGADRLAPTPMPVNPPATPKKALPPEANTPVLIQRILDVTTLDDLLSMLGNNVHTKVQQACIYSEVKIRRSIEGNRFNK